MSEHKNQSKLQIRIGFSRTDMTRTKNFVCLCSKFGSHKVHKLRFKSRGVGGQKNLLFVNFYTIENVNGGG